MRDTEALVRKIKNFGRQDKPPVAKPAGEDPEMKHLGERLQQALGTQVKVLRKGEGGTLEIRFYNAGDLDRLLELLKIH